MQPLLVAAQLAVALGVLYAWLVRYRSPTPFRGGSAQSMPEEFDVYGLPKGSVRIVGAIKVALALALIAGVFLPVLTRPAALGMAAFMVGAVAMHLKVGDPPLKSVPAALALLLSLLVAFA